MTLIMAVLKLSLLAALGILGFSLVRLSTNLQKMMALLMILWIGFLQINFATCPSCSFSIMDLSLSNLTGAFLNSLPFILIGVCGSAYIERCSTQLNKVLTGISIFTIAALILFGTMQKVGYPENLSTQVIQMVGWFLFLIPATFLVLKKDVQKQEIGMAFSAFGVIILLSIWTPIPGLILSVIGLLFFIICGLVYIRNRIYHSKK